MRSYEPFSKWRMGATTARERPYPRVNTLVPTADRRSRCAAGWRGRSAAGQGARVAGTGSTHAARLGGHRFAHQVMESPESVNRTATTVVSSCHTMSTSQATAPWPRPVQQAPRFKVLVLRACLAVTAPSVECHNTSEYGVGDGASAYRLPCSA
jgi:hypothetical protein